MATICSNAETCWEHFVCILEDWNISITFWADYSEYSSLGPVLATSSFWELFSTLFAFHKGCFNVPWACKVTLTSFLSLMDSPKSRKQGCVECKASASVSYNKYLGIWRVNCTSSYSFITPFVLVPFIICWNKGLINIIRFISQLYKSTAVE